jgi:tetratricopeptide (TPR) repeat protein
MVMRGIILAIALANLLAGCAMQTQNQEVSKVDAFTLVGNADKAYAAGDWKAAEQGYREVIKKVPADAYAYFRLGNTLAKQLQFEQAAAAYQESLARDASKTKVYNNLAMIRLLQAEAALSASLKTIPAHDGSSAQLKHMLWQLKKVTRVNLQEINSPVATSH